MLFCDFLISGAVNSVKAVSSYLKFGVRVQDSYIYFDSSIEKRFRIKRFDIVYSYLTYLIY